MTRIMTILQREILMQRQDAHITTYHIHEHLRKWKEINEYDIAESRRLGKI